MGAGPPHWLGDPRIGGRVGGVKRPEERDERSGEERGDQGEAAVGGDTVHGMLGGELPQAELLLPLLVRRRCGTGGVPIENWICGGDIETMSGCGGGGWVRLPAGADTRRDLTGNCLVGERGEERVLERVLRRTGDSRTGASGSAPASSSGSGPRLEPPEAELTPDMADTEVLSSGATGRPPLREATSEFWIAA